MANIDYVIGAKNDATGPINQAAGSLDKLGKTSTDTAAKTTSATQKISVSIGSLAKMATVVAAVDVAIQLAGKAISSVVGSFSAANAAYDQQTEAVAKLESAIQRSGQAFAGQSQQLQDAASALQELTGVGDEVTLGLMQQASVLGVHASQLDDVTRAAAGLSEATGKSLEESMRMATDATQGNFEAYSKLIPEINRATTVEQKLALVQAYATRGLEAKAAASNRLVGMEERASGAIGDMMEKVGALLAPIRLLIASGVKALAETMGGLLTGAAEKATAMMEQMAPVLEAIKTAVNVLGQVISTVFGVIGDIVSDLFGNTIASAGDIFTTVADKIVEYAVWLANGVIGAVTMMEVVYNNFGKIVDMAISYVLLAYETYRADTMQLFTVTLPEYISWFADNFFNIIQDVFNAVITAIGNYLKIIANNFLILFDFIRSGMKGGIGGLMADLADNVVNGMTNILDGFEAKTESLPDIMARKLTDREQELADKIGKIGTDLGDEFADKFAARSIKLGDKIGKDLSTEVDLKFDPKAKKTETKALQSKESRLLTRGSVQDRQKELLKMIQNQGATLNKIAESTGGTQTNTAKLAGTSPLGVQLIP